MTEEAFTTNVYIINHFLGLNKEIHNIKFTEEIKDIYYTLVAISRLNNDVAIYDFHVLFINICFFGNEKDILTMMHLYPFSEIKISKNLNFLIELSKMLYGELIFLLKFNPKKENQDIHKTYYYTPNVLYNNYKIICNYIDNIEMAKPKRQKINHEINHQLTSSQSQY